MTMTHEMKDELIRDLELQLKNARTAQRELGDILYETKAALGIVPRTAASYGDHTPEVVKAANALGDRVDAAESLLDQLAEELHFPPDTLLEATRGMRQRLDRLEMSHLDAIKAKAQLEQTEKLFDQVINSIYREDQ